VDWQAAQAPIEVLREIVQRNSRAAALEVELVQGASARVAVVQQLLISRVGPAASSAGDAAAEGQAVESTPTGQSQTPPSRRPAGVARLRDGPLADLFRATGPSPGES
jgi:hypothetical protein